MVCKSHSVLNEISCKYTKTRTSHLIHVQGTCRKPNITNERGAHAYAWAPTIHSVILFFYLLVSERYRLTANALIAIENMSCFHHDISRISAMQR